MCSRRQEEKKKDLKRARWDFKEKEKETSIFYENSRLADGEIPFLPITLQDSKGV